MTQSRKNNFKTWIILILVGGGLIWGTHNYLRHQSDKRLADKVYQQLVIIDGKLNNMQSIAESINQQKALNRQIITVLDGLTKDNIEATRPRILALVQQANYLPDFKTEVNDSITNLTPTNFDTERKILTVKIRELKYTQSAAENNFDAQIEQIANQVQQLSREVSQIKGENLQQLELAKLKFIMHKLKSTAEKLHEAVLQEVEQSIFSKLKLNETESN